MAGLTKIKSGGITPGCDLDGSGTLKLDSTNNRVGINEASPTHPLHIDADVDQLRLSDGSGGFDIRAGNIFKISDDGTERMRIDGAGNLGINQTSVNATRKVEITQPSSYTSGLRVNSAGSSGNPALIEFFVGLSNYKIGGHHSTDQLKFMRNTAELMIIDSSGNVGIGTTNPAAGLHLGDTQATSGIQLGTGTDFTIKREAGTAGVVFNVGSDLNNYQFDVGNSEKMRIDSSGNVGIGTTSPDARLDISVTGAANGSTTDTLILNNDNSNTGDNLATRIRFSRSGNSSSNVYTALDSIRVGTHDTDFAISTNNGGTLSEHIRLHSNGRVGLGTNGTAAAGTGVDVTVRMTPATSGYGIYSSNFSSGTTSTPAGYGVYGHMGGLPPSGSAHYGVYGKVDTHSTRASGGLLAYSINNSVYGIVGYWSTAAYYSFYGNGAVYATGGFSSSDARLKDIVSDGIGTGILDKVCKLQAKKFTWKDNTQQRRGCENVLIGLLAQDVQIDFPEVVDSVKQPKITGANPETLNEQIGDNLAVDYGKLVPVLVEALKEAKERIETLEAEVAALKSN